MIFRQPFAQAWRQQQLLLRQIGSVALWHKTLCHGSVHFRPANMRIPVGALSGAGRYYSDSLTAFLRRLRLLIASSQFATNARICGADRPRTRPNQVGFAARFYLGGGSNANLA